jgi:hypothetical protein
MDAFETFSKADPYDLPGGPLTDYQILNAKRGLKDPDHGVQKIFEEELKMVNEKVEKLKQANAKTPQKKAPELSEEARNQQFQNPQAGVDRMIVQAIYNGIATSEKKTNGAVVSTAKIGSGSSTQIAQGTVIFRFREKAYLHDSFFDPNKDKVDQFQSHRKIVELTKGDQIKDKDGNKIDPFSPDVTKDTKISGSVVSDNVIERPKVLAKKQTKGSRSL